MPIPFTCPNPKCGKKLQARDELAGQSVKCPACMQVSPLPLHPAGAKIEVPQKQELAPADRRKEVEPPTRNPQGAWIIATAAMILLLVGACAAGVWFFLRSEALALQLAASQQKAAVQERKEADAGAELADLNKRLLEAERIAKEIKVGEEEPKKPQETNKPEPLQSITKEKLLGEWKGPEDKAGLLVFDDKEVALKTYGIVNGMFSAQTFSTTYRIDSRAITVEILDQDKRESILGIVRMSQDGALIVTLNDLDNVKFQRVDKGQGKVSQEPKKAPATVKAVADFAGEWKADEGVFSKQEGGGVLLCKISNISMSISPQGKINASYRIEDFPSGDMVRAASVEISIKQEKDVFYINMESERWELDSPSAGGERFTLSHPGDAIPTSSLHFKRKDKE